MCTNVYLAAGKVGVGVRGGYMALFPLSLFPLMEARQGRHKVMKERER